ncbi:MAG: hypothetical protein ABR609_10405 [Acidimicrobiia bacterium]
MSTRSVQILMIDAYDAIDPLGAATLVSHAQPSEVERISQPSDVFVGHHRILHSAQDRQPILYLDASRLGYDRVESQPCPIRGYLELRVGSNAKCISKHLRSHNPTPD